MSHERSTGTRTAYLLVAITLVLATLGSHRSAAEEPLVLTLPETLSRAAQRPRAVAAEQRAQAAEHLAEAASRLTRWPSVTVSSELDRRDRDYLFDTPVGEFSLGKRTSSAASLRLTQPLLDPAQRFHAVPAARSDAEGERHQAVRLRQLLAGEAAHRFLDVLSVEARIRATEAFIVSLEARLAEIVERVEAGRALEADALKIKLDLDSARLDRATLGQMLAIARRQLGRAVGHDGPVAASFAGPFHLPLAETPQELIARAQATRAELSALDARRHALEKRASATRAERLPRLEAGASYFLSDGDPLRPEEQLTGHLQLVWTPFANHTRKPRAAAFTAQAEATRGELEDERRRVVVEVHTALAHLARARTAVEVRQTGIDLAAESLRVERERYAGGRATTNDLLAAEAALRDQQTEHDLARIAVARARIDLSLAVGDDELWPTTAPSEEAP